MRLLAQRVKQASVSVEGEVIGRVGPGLLLLVGVGEEDLHDGGDVLEAMAQKVLNLRIFNDEDGKMNRSLLDQQGQVLAVSQFTLHADCRKGRRPSFIKAGQPEAARTMFNQFVDQLRGSGIEVQTGRFGAMMDVALVNDGPVTIWLDSTELFA